MSTLGGPTQPTGDEVDLPTTPTRGNAASDQTLTTKPRVWPLFALSVVELVVASVLQGAVAIILITMTLDDYGSFQEAAQALPTRLLEPPIFVLMLVLSSLSIAVGAWLFGWISARHQQCSCIDRLGLRWPKISTPSMVGLLLGSVPVLLISVGIVILIEKVLPGDESVLKLYKNITNGWAFIFIVSIGILPGFGEELFFRGFFQRRMLQRFRPAVAIGVTSLVFGLFHVTPHGIALATIIGVWLGVIAWRTNSIWPSACCHAFINSGWNVYQVGRYRWGFPDVPPIWFCVAGGVIVLAAFIWSVRFLVRTTRPATG